MVDVSAKVTLFAQMQPVHLCDLRDRCLRLGALYVFASSRESEAFFRPARTFA